MRQAGKIQPRKAAKLLGVHLNTVYAYCRRAVAGEASPLREVHQNPLTGYYWLSLTDVMRLKGQEKR